MNALEKAQLIKELHDLLNYLDNHTLNFFEIAKTKNRIKQIFSLCDEPIFHKQQREFKLLAEPKKSAWDFAKNTPYTLSFLGYFQSQTELEEQHAAHETFGWAFLHIPARGWQIQVYAPHLSPAWHSGWDSFDHVYALMLEEQHVHRLLSDEALRAAQITIAPADAPEAPSDLESPYNFNEKLFSEDESDFEDNAAALHQTAEPHLLGEHEIELGDSAAAAERNTDGLNQHTDLETAAPKEDVYLDAIQGTASTDYSSQSHELKGEAESAIPEASAQQPHTLKPQQISIFKLKAELTPLLSASDKDESLYTVRLIDMPDAEQHIRLLMPANALENWQNLPAALAEQVSEKGKFLSYIMLFGMTDHAQAMRIFNQYTRQTGQPFAAMKEISLDSLGMDFTDADLLFHAYQQRAELIWAADQYHPFIPAHLLHTQKFILFDEKPATDETPILLLQERNKTRVIHGENRIALNPSDMAYPYLMLHRQHDITWQRIHTIILEMQEPIDVLELYHAIGQIQAE